MRSRSSAVLLAVVACGRPSPLVICHNANCSGVDVSRDDTLAALRDSLALQYGGRPTIDGVEWDISWDGAGARCVFAHDLSASQTTPAGDAAQAIADYLSATATPEPFYVIIELKASVSPGSFTDDHTPAQRTAHAECALDALDTIAAGARTQGHRLTVGFVSANQAMFDTLQSQPRWPGYAAASDLQLLRVGDIFAPYSSAVPRLADYGAIDAVEFHPDFMTREEYETYRSLGLALVQWQFVMTPEAFDSIERWQPEYVLTSEANLLRGWSER